MCFNNHTCVIVSRDTKWELYDVTVKSENGVVFQCHRCVLVARLEYFHSMLATGWMEVTLTSFYASIFNGRKSLNS